LLTKGINDHESRETLGFLRRVYPENSWPQSWKDSYFYDLQEIYHEISNRGYAYAYENRRKHTLRLIEEVLSPGATILDIAAAQGNFSLALAEMGYAVTWNDLRSELADYVRLKQERGRISFAPGNVFELSFPSPFDGVLIGEIIEHVAHPDDFLTTIAALVHPGGYVFMTTPNGAYFRNTLPKFSECSDPSIYEQMQFKPNADGHIFLLHPDEIPSLATAAGLRVDHVELFNNPLTSGHMKLEFLLCILPKSVVTGLEQISQKIIGSSRSRFFVHMAVRFRK
jgi:2-polyprenyl-3-methyl-5-hydroxy-6-metoxy-1,4-benzoquinol methylase